jgi:hypothetical protein
MRRVMKKALAGSAVTALTAAAFLFLYSAPTAGQGKQGQPEPAGINPAGGGVPMASLERLKTKASGPAPRAADGKPDLSGIWGPESHLIGDIAAALKPGDKLPLQPWALKLTRARLSKDDPNASCLPSGIPRQSPFPFKIIQTPKEIVFLVEGNVHTYRQVFMDGSGHPKDMDPTWFGDSRGTWQGDTLVVDTVGFNDKFWFDGIGHPHTEKLHVIERYRRSDAGHLDYEITIDDPGAYTRPFTLYGHSPLLQNTEIMEYFCIENNQDVAHILGKGTPARE